MHQTDLPLYPKTMSIYNKILQLGIAVILAIVTAHFWLQSFVSVNDDLNNHFNQTGDSFIEQAVVSAKVLLQTKQNKALEQFVAQLPQADIVYDAKIYDVTGQVIAESEKNLTINQLFGVSEGSVYQANQYVPFMLEIRDDKLLGYLRLTLDKSKITAPIEHRIQLQGQAVLLMLGLAMLIGFLLSRGFSRFHRQNLKHNKPAKH